jgi:signal transduction histidine kinase
MKKLFAWMLMLAAATAFQDAAAADSTRATPDEARAIVKKAIAYYKKVGREKSMPEFCRTDGPFVDRDLYVTVIALDGLELAHINPKSVGKNVLDLRDGDGKYFIRERMDAAKTAASGSQEFKFFNPVTKKIEAKTAYWERVDDLVFSSGAYKPL